MLPLSVAQDVKVERPVRFSSSKRRRAVKALNRRFSSSKLFSRFVSETCIPPCRAYDVKWSDNHVARPGELKRAVEFAQRVGLKMIGATTKTLTRTERVGGIEIRMLPLRLHCCRIGKAQIGSAPGPAWELER